MSEETTVSTDVRMDDFEGMRIHTFVRNGRPCWLLFELERALREEVYDFDTRTEFESRGFDAFDGEDFQRLERADIQALLSQTDAPPDVGPIVLLYEGGLTLACGGSPKGHAIRRRLLKDAAEPILRAARRAHLERRVREMLKQIEFAERARKVALLHRLIEHARFCGPLRLDDDGYVLAMGILSEIATGLTLPTDGPPDTAETDAATGSVRAALHRLCDDMNA
jgi:hypothetical protein